MTGTDRRLVRDEDSGRLTPLDELVGERIPSNAPAAAIRMPGQWFNGDNTPCDVCGGHLPDHDWADLDDQDPPRVVDCSGETR